LSHEELEEILCRFAKEGYEDVDHVSRSESSAKLLARREGSDYPVLLNRSQTRWGNCVVQFEDTFIFDDTEKHESKNIEKMLAISEYLGSERK